MRLRDVVPSKRRLDGKKVELSSILNRELHFTDWSIQESKVEKGTRYMILQFELDGETRVVMTGSKCLIEDVESYEKEKGHEPFDAIIVKHNKAYVFE